MEVKICQKLSGETEPSPVLLVGTLLLILAICFQAEISRNEVTRKINKKQTSSKHIAKTLHRNMKYPLKNLWNWP